MGPKQCPHVLRQVKHATEGRETPSGLCGELLARTLRGCSSLGTPSPDGRPAAFHKRKDTEYPTRRTRAAKSSAAEAQSSPNLKPDRCKAWACQTPFVVCIRRRVSDRTSGGVAVAAPALSSSSTSVLSVTTHSPSRHGQSFPERHKVQSKGTACV